MMTFPPTARPGVFSSHLPCAIVFILDPFLGGAHGQGLLPELELGPLPRNCPSPLCSHPAADKSGHLVSAGPGGRGGKPVLLAPELALHERDSPAHICLAFHVIQRESRCQRGPSSRKNTNGEQERDNESGG